MATIQLTSSDYFNQATKDTAEQVGGNILALPRISKVVINVGIGKFKAEKSQQEEILDLIEKLTGQIPKKNYSSKAISGFKLREGELVGVTVTLRGKKMKDFLLNLIYLALPRTKDFKGIKNTSWDGNHACYSIGIPDASIFPQIGFNAKVNFGMQVNVCFREGSKNNVTLLKNLKFPFHK